MQTCQWYYWRLKSMSPAEIAWRVQAGVQGLGDRVRFMLGMVPGAAREAAMALADAPPPFRVGTVSPESYATVANAGWMTRLRQHADELATHRLSFFNLQAHHLGDPVDWHRDHSANVAAPRTYSPSIDYRDFRVAGDCKLVWEPSRHHHLVVLARAYRATGDRKYARAVAEQLDSWLRDNPFPIGMNWRSGLELGVRLVNWVWVWDLIRDSGVIDEDLRRRFLESVYLHCWENTRKYSQGSSSNNHLVGEAAGVYAACAYFDRMPNATRWREQARGILVRELERQSFADGCTREQAIGYQMFVLEFYVSCGLLGRWRGEDFPAAYWSRVEKMIEFLGLLLEGGDRLPFFGDYDDGYVLDLGRHSHDPRDLLAIGSLLFDRADFRAWAGGPREPVLWLLGTEAASRFAASPPVLPRRLRSQAFPASGHYLLQTGTAGDPDRISLHVDCAELGFGSIAAHGHADALGFVLRAFGTDVFVDPGTYDYYTDRPWRDYFRSTRAHNTVEIDGLDQSTMLGNFMWGQRAGSQCLEWQPHDDGGTFLGQHDGYMRLAAPAMHRRRLTLDGARRQVVIDDEIESAGPHDIALYFHLADQCRAELVDAHNVAIAVAGGTVRLRVDPALTLELLHASESPIQAWTSPGYHRRTPTCTIAARCKATGSIRFTSTIQIQP